MKTVSWRLILVPSHRPLYEPLIPCDVERFVVESEPEVQEIDVTTILSEAKEFTAGIKSPRRTTINVSFRGAKPIRFLQSCFSRDVYFSATLFAFYPSAYTVIVGSFIALELGVSKGRAPHSLALRSIGTVTCTTHSLDTAPARRSSSARNLR